MLKSKFYVKKLAESFFPDIIDFKNKKIIINNEEYNFEECSELKHTGLFDINQNPIYEKDTLKFYGIRGIVLYILDKFVVEAINQDNLMSTYFPLNEIFYDSLILK